MANCGQFTEHKTLIFALCYTAYSTRSYVELNTVVPNHVSLIQFGSGVCTSVTSGAYYFISLTTQMEAEPNLGTNAALIWRFAFLIFVHVTAFIQWTK